MSSFKADAKTMGWPFAEYVSTHTDKYFTKSRQIAEQCGDKTVTYGFFLRRPVLCAIVPVLEWLESIYRHAERPTSPAPLQIVRHFEEGAFVPAERCLFSVTGSYVNLSELETLALQKTGLPCVAAYNAYRSCMALKSVAFMDMHARHGFSDDMNQLTAYGGGLGSRMAKLQGAKGFIGSSQDATAWAYGATDGMGTMPHAIIGYAGSTCAAAHRFNDVFPKQQMTVLVDYFGKEYTDALQVCHAYSGKAERGELAVRIDTHGGRFAENLDYNKSVKLVCDWLHVGTEFEAVKRVMGDDAFEMDTLNIGKDRVRKVLFGTGVSVANIVQMNRTLEHAGFRVSNQCYVQIVGSSGFDSFKCGIFGKAAAPIDMVGTGSFLPETLSETYATADIYKYGDEFSVKVGREHIFKGL